MKQPDTATAATRRSRFVVRPGTRLMLIIDMLQAEGRAKRGRCIIEGSY